ncbi:hypothetical protein LLG95_00560 [bacterium]|nr:hypothetical protein [bacterium]
MSPRITTRPLPLQEQEYRVGLLRLERTAIIPFKFCTLLATFVLWIKFIGSEQLSEPAFFLFLLYFLSILAQCYFFYVSTVTMNQIRPFTLISYLIDVVFVTLLIFFDTVDLNTIEGIRASASLLQQQTIEARGIETNHNFYLLYFLLVMRGFALFKTLKETIFVNLLISIIYIITMYLRTYDPHNLFTASFSISLVLIWLVIIMSWFLVMLITKQKIELLEVHERLLRSESLVRVGELAAGVAHEINNPIGIIATTAAYLKRSLPDDSEHVEDIKMIEDEAMRCKEIVQEMLTYANPRTLGTTLLQPQAINDEVLDFVFPRKRESRFEVVREYGEELPLMEADPNLLKQALLNLYMNARQAIPEERMGRIISRIGADRHGRTITFEIEDNGVGIAAEDIEHIFEPFFTRKARGTGLGLAVTQRIVEKFNGRISVHNADGEGTVFALEFPAVRA